MKIFSPRDFPSYLPKLNSLYDDLFSGGKGFRSKLVQIFSKHLQMPDATTQLLCQTIEFIHNSSLLHDDLIDRSILRRGKPAAWTVYSPEYAVLAGDYLLARVMVNLSKFGNIKLVQFTAEMISDLLEGEWLQDSIHNDYLVSLQQLDRIHDLKTASLFRWCFEAPLISLGDPNPAAAKILSQAGSVLGCLFQRGDDLLDYDVRNAEGKAILGDLKSGYLNSFGSFIAQKLSRSNLNLLVQAKELTEFKQAMGGEEVFKQNLKEFVEINEKQIKLYQNLILKLKEVLPVAGEELAQDLLPLPKILYYREKST